MLVRINKADHPMHGMIGTITETTEDGFKRVRLLNSSFSAYLPPEDLQPIEERTRRGDLLLCESCKMMVDPDSLKGHICPPRPM